MALEELILGILGILASILYVIVVLALRRREVSPDARPAHRGFMLWWGGLAIVGLVSAYLSLVRDIGGFGLLGGRVVLYGLVALIMVMLAGLAYYLLFLYTGRHSMMPLAAAFYAAMMAAFVLYVELQQPAIVDGVWVYSQPFPPDSLPNILIGIGLVGPPLVAAGAYMALYRKAPDATIRYRILMVSGAFVLWFGWSVASTFLQAALGLQEPTFWMQLVSQFMGVVAAMAVLLAYLPPKFLQERGIQPAVQWRRQLNRLQVFASTPNLKSTPPSAKPPHAG